MICTCLWSPVSTATIDIPHIVARDEDCPVHGDKKILDELERDLNRENHND